MHPEQPPPTPDTGRSRWLALIEPPLALGLVFGISIFFGMFGFVATAFLVEEDPLESLFGMERKLGVELIHDGGETIPTIEETKRIVAAVFDVTDVIVIPEGERAWQLLAWIRGEPAPSSSTELTQQLGALGWSDPVPTVTTLPRYFGAMENPRRMRMYIPPAMTIQALVFSLGGWVMVRWRDPRALRDPARLTTALLWGGGAAIVAFIGSTLVGGGLQLTGWEIEEQGWIQALMADRASLLLLTPWLVVLGPVSEEVFFRGYVFRRLFSSAGPRAAYLVSAVLFALIHWHPVGLPMYLLIGLVFCWVYQKTGNLWAPVLAHVIYNGFVVTLPLLAPVSP
ncbi:MAG: CPBP family intramembrane metalloprotease [Acidobacteria bacterium]|nr:CPBP family intramembrane metalloprotease [Acidobacteriota bacterium]NIM60755.1 CPBP family intramembrane metalloprotease [Acidobacteriota bacterium]NIO57968.1 CPBP family intramembrane metalloprotease [Acidobacteriota bacterium]NIQ28973.1 CPBP family intramembrane metalloprotease [Acidobacteriota bacterium]NIQ83445.1 CPBP family intramembrane metalloprotease [Acidobacteriota bacterium]